MKLDLQRRGTVDDGMADLRRSGMILARWLAE
jgi:hypothetical protein